MSKTILAAGSATDIGQVRSANQDSKLLANGIYAVADGMGGHKGGEVASAIAVEVLGKLPIEPTEAALVEAAGAANRAVFDKASQSAELRGMGTTLCAVMLVDTGTEEEPDDELAWINVGDSRIYLLRDDALIQLTTDHSLVEDMRRDGQITAEEAAVHPQRNIVTRALGIEFEVNVDSGAVIPYRGDRFLLCSDGLFNEVTEDKIKGTLRRLINPNEAASELVRQANEHGGRDNITVVIVDVMDDGGRSIIASEAIGEDPDAESMLASRPIEPPTTPTPRVDPDDLAGFSLPIAEPPAKLAAHPPAPESDEPSVVTKARKPSKLTEASDELWDKAVRPDDRDHLGAELDHARVRHITGRVVLFFLAIVLIAAAAVGYLMYDWNNSYYVGRHGDDVVIYHGKPSGELWFSTSIEEPTSLKFSQLKPVDQDTVKAQKVSSLAAAQKLRDYLTGQVTKAQAAATTTTTTSTTTSTTVVPTATAPPAGPTTIKP